MNSKTSIEWTDATWNPMTGCTKLSMGCDHCYAAVIAARRTRDIYLAQPPVRDTETAWSDPFAPRFWPARLAVPLTWRRPRRVFVNSMSDIFHAHFQFDQIAQVFAVMNAAPQHQFQLLTKRPERALRLAAKLDWTPNIWLGTSVEDLRVGRRIDVIRRVPAALRFISAEPLLGSLAGLDLSGIHWVIGGGESGPGARPCDPTWALDLRDACIASGVAFFWKQWGGATTRAKGRVLDGREWNEYPVPLGAQVGALPGATIAAVATRNRCVTGSPGRALGTFEVESELG